jgi:prevent-host-death family protein
MATVVNMHQAKASLSRLVERALAGEEVVIARNGQPLIQLVPVPKQAEALEKPPLTSVSEAPGNK